MTVEILENCDQNLIIKFNNLIKLLNHLWNSRKLWSKEVPIEQIINIL